MVDTMDLGGLSKDAGGVIHEEGVVVPALPQFVAYLQKFVGALVALVVLLRFTSSLHGLVTIGKSNDIPPHPPTREAVECGEEAGDPHGGLPAHSQHLVPPPSSHPPP